VLVVRQTRQRELGVFVEVVGPLGVL
jgi:hypothetical protein